MAIVGYRCFQAGSNGPGRRRSVGERQGNPPAPLSPGAGSIPCDPAGRSGCRAGNDRMVCQHGFGVREGGWTWIVREDARRRFPCSGVQPRPTNPRRPPVTLLGRGLWQLRRFFLVAHGIVQSRHPGKAKTIAPGLLPVNRIIPGIAGQFNAVGHGRLRRIRPFHFNGDIT